MAAIIIKNQAKCRLCGDIIESRNRHDFQMCKCGAISVDGGHDYTKRSFKYSPDDIIDMSIIQTVDFGED